MAVSTFRFMQNKEQEHRWSHPEDVIIYLGHLEILFAHHWTSLRWPLSYHRPLCLTFSKRLGGLNEKHDGIGRESLILYNLYALYILNYAFVSWQHWHLN